MIDMIEKPEIVVIGGAGHIGLPLSIHLAHSRPIAICDTDEQRLTLLRRGSYPYREANGQYLLDSVRERLMLTDNLTDCADCRIAIFATYEVTQEFVEQTIVCLPRTEFIVLRSTVPVGTTRGLIAAATDILGERVGVAYCPDRSVEGDALRELRLLPQLVGCDSNRDFMQVRKLFSHAPSFIRLTPDEAEAAKLMTNTYRFAHFALANELFISLLEQGIDPQKVFSAATVDYPRMSGLPSAGFVGGPCLRKDSMMFMKRHIPQLDCLHAALRTNDGMARSLVEFVKKQISLSTATVGVLGYAFKAECDDTRWSPAKELADILTSEAQHVLCTDPYVDGPGLATFEEVIESADVVFVAAPHEVYRGKVIPAGKIVVDPWGILGKRSTVLEPDVLGNGAAIREHSVPTT
jgi:UDP-N-acetyl-D-mannosaminuronic acid dehydrogenase